MAFLFLLRQHIANTFTAGCSLNLFFKGILTGIGDLTVALIRNRIETFRELNAPLKEHVFAVASATNFRSFVANGTANLVCESFWRILFDDIKLAFSATESRLQL